MCFLQSFLSHIDSLGGNAGAPDETKTSHMSLARFFRDERAIVRTISWLLITVCVRLGSWFLALLNFFSAVVILRTKLIPLVAYIYRQCHWSIRYLGIVITFFTIYIGSLTDEEGIFHIPKNHTAECNELWSSVMGQYFSHTSEILVVAILAGFNVAFLFFGMQAHHRVSSLWQKASGGAGTSLINTAEGTTLRR